MSYSLNSLKGLCRGSYKGVVQRLLRGILGVYSGVCREYVGVM